jgi:hypothetical protein
MMRFAGLLVAVYPSDAPGAMIVPWYGAPSAMCRIEPSKALKVADPICDFPET